MNTESDPQRELKPFRFSMRTLLVIMTGLCLLGAILANTLEPVLQIFVWVGIFFSAIMAVWSYRSYQKEMHRMATPPLETVTVEIDAKWIQRVRSRWFFVVAALTGVSVTFAPLYLVICGSVKDFGLLEWILVPVCILTIYLVPGFYMRLAVEVMQQLRKQEISNDDRSESEKK